MDEIRLAHGIARCGKQADRALKPFSFTRSDESRQVGGGSCDSR